MLSSGIEAQVCQPSRTHVDTFLKMLVFFNIHTELTVDRGMHDFRRCTARYPYAVGNMPVKTQCWGILMPTFTTAIPTPAPMFAPRHACNHSIVVNVHCYHVVVIHASPAYRSIRCVLHMDPCKAINVGISVSHVGLSTVCWGLLSHHTTVLLLLPVPRADGTVARSNNSDGLGVFGLVILLGV